MIERHYFIDRLIKSFDFTFPFCVPDSTNTWYSEYELPPMDNALSEYSNTFLSLCRFPECDTSCLQIA